jgi:hypothetical protein
MGVDAWHPPVSHVGSVHGDCGEAPARVGVRIRRLGIGALVLVRLGVDRLPGTIYSKPGENVRVIVPVLLMVVVSVVGTIVLNVLFRR